MTRTRRIVFFIGIHSIFYFLAFVYLNFSSLAYFLARSNGLDHMNDQTTAFTVAYRQLPLTLEPSSLDASVKNVLYYVCEGLVSFDKNLNIRSKLAVSWGQEDDTHWRFVLRPDVVFHDGSRFSANDVLASFERLSELNNSPLAYRLRSIDSIRALDNMTLIITTKYPDPLLLQKLTDFFILPSSYISGERDNSEAVRYPLGTGPYQIVAWRPGEFVQLKSFMSYYEKRDMKDSVHLIALPNKHARVGSVRKRDTDILVDTPTEFVTQIRDRFGYTIYSLPRFESTFLLFNFKSDYFVSESMRRAIAYAIDYKGIEDLIGRFGSRLSQFVPSGVFGYDPRIIMPVFDPDHARKLIADAGYEGKYLKLNLLTTDDNNTLAYFIKNVLESVGIKIRVVTKDPLALLQALEKGEGDLYILGWRFYDGDAHELFRSLVHSRMAREKDSTGVQYGVYNGISYKNYEVDRLIEESERELDEKERLKIIQKIMAILLFDDVYGVPLFQSHQVYAVAPWVTFTPRIDTLVDI